MLRGDDKTNKKREIKFLKTLCARLSRRPSVVFVNEKSIEVVLGTKREIKRVTCHPSKCVPLIAAKLLLRDLRALIEATRPRRLCHKRTTEKKKKEQQIFIMSGYKYFFLCAAHDKRLPVSCICICGLIKVMEKHESGWERCCARFMGEGGIYDALGCGVRRESRGKRSSSASRINLSRIKSLNFGN
jgi:hypothetical protein